MEEIVNVSRRLEGDETYNCLLVTKMYLEGKERGGGEGEGAYRDIGLIKLSTCIRVLPSHTQTHTLHRHVLRCCGQSLVRHRDLQ